MRYRERSWSGEPQSGTISGTSYTFANGEQVETAFGPTTVWSDAPTIFESVTDVSTPDWKKRIAKGEIINNPFEYIRIQEFPVTPTPISREMINDVDGLWWGTIYSGTWIMQSDYIGDYLDTATLSGNTADDLRDQALASAYAEANSTEWALAMVAAEADKTVLSIVSILKRALKIFRAVKKLDIKYLRSQISRKELEDRYMELRYAIRPLLYDIRSAENAFNAKLTDKPIRKTFRGKAVDQLSSNDTIVNDGGSWEFTVDRSYKSTLTVRAGVLCEVTVSRLDIFGRDQILETLWEITPWSFILNWFIDISTFISAWTPNAGIKALASWTTIHAFHEWKNQCVNVQNTYSAWDGPNSVSFSGEKSKTYLHKRRVVNPELPRLPSTKVNLNALKLLDLAIILKNFR